MKTVITRMIAAVTIVLCMASISAAAQCKKARALLDGALAEKPWAMTAESIKMALEQCPQNAEMYYDAARYYKDWYERDVPPEDKVKYKGNAIEYYREGIQWARGAILRNMQRELNALERTTEDFEALFRAVKPGIRIKMEVHFDFNSYALRKGVQDHLDKLGKVMAEKEDIRIKLEGHTDRSGTKSYNDKLSIERAKSVKRYLVDNYHIDENRIFTAGYGYERLADVSDPYSAQNRRVEVMKLAE